MAYLTVELNIAAEQIGDLVSDCNLGDKHDAINGIINQLAKVASGGASGSLKIVIKDSASTIAPSGVGSLSVTYPA
jgi:hypothetical protein